MTGLLRDYFRDSRVFQSRVTIAGVLVLILAMLLFLRLAYIQVFSHKYYETLAQENRINPVPIHPPRGLVLDRNGVVLAQNFPVFTLEVVPEQVDDMQDLLTRLRQFVALNERDLRNFRRQVRERPRYESIILRSNLSEEEAARVALNRLHFDGLELKARLQRHYPQGGLGVHALGYVGRINEQEMGRIDKTAYRGMTHIGKLGVELAYEDLLLGKVGSEQVENDAHGRAIRVLGRTPPRAGQNLHLHLDARMQALAEQALGKYKGAVIALDPQTGGILTFASTPIYDPNLFVNGIDTRNYLLLRDSRDRPLINRALNGRYSPGSTIKPFLGLAALAAGDIRTEDVHYCPGYFTLPGSRHRFRDWKKEGHGPVNLHDAVVQSCDVYFYKLAVSVGIERLKTFLDGFGFGAKTGIDIPGESTGLVPSLEWKKGRGEPWYPGETVVTGIGQGPILVTPLQLASAVAGIATRGTRVEPRLLRAIEDPATKSLRYPEASPTTPIAVGDRRHIETMVQNMVDVVHGRGGTGARIGFNAPYKIAGKTGTAQVKSIGQQETYNEKRTAEHLRDHALFIAFAPAEAPKIAIAVIVENGGHGSSVAAPIARLLMDYYLLGEDQGASPSPATATTTNGGD
jgi:penicillin-binding protein 2